MESNASFIVLRKYYIGAVVLVSRRTRVDQLVTVNVASFCTTAPP